LEDLTAKVQELATTAWGNIPNARVLPTADDLTFGNSGERLEVTILYADIHRSTQMVDELADTLAAEYYKAFLHCAAKVIKANDGQIQAYDGDRVMAVFVGESQADNAVKAAMQIYHAVLHVINPAFAAAYPIDHREIKHTVGIDTGTVLVAKTGVRVDSDLVWVGPAANYAAKLNSFDGLDAVYPTRITTRVFAKLTNQCLYNGNDLMWQGAYTNLKHSHYRSAYSWRIT
jgi:class 3 adenylate cyclase